MTKTEQFWRVKINFYIFFALIFNELRDLTKVLPKIDLFFDKKIRIFVA